MTVRPISGIYTALASAYRGGNRSCDLLQKVPSGTKGMCAEADRTSRAGLSRLGSVIWAVRGFVQACAGCGLGSSGHGYRSAAASGAWQRTVE